MWTTRTLAGRRRAGSTASITGSSIGLANSASGLPAARMPVAGDVVGDVNQPGIGAVLEQDGLHDRRVEVPGAEVGRQRNDRPGLWPGRGLGGLLGLLQFAGHGPEGKGVPPVRSMRGEEGRG